MGIFTVTLIPPLKKKTATAYLEICLSDPEILDDDGLC